MFLQDLEYQVKNSYLLDRLEAIIAANRTSLDEICQYSLDIRSELLSDISPVLELLTSLRNNNAVMETPDWIEAQHLVELIAQTKSEIDSLFSDSPDVVVEKSNEIIAKLNKYNSDLLIITQRIHSVIIKISKSKVFPALSNLINNSLYWVLNQQIRTILIRFDEAARTLYVEDSGAGIAAANREKIFEPFVSYKPNGRGLGLTIARKVLESQGHRLEVASDTEKVLSGACFKIVFSEEAMEVN